MLARFQEKKTGGDTWPRGGVIKPASWQQLSETYGMLAIFCTIFISYILFIIIASFFQLELNQGFTIQV